jgi:hypothetical protein
MIVVGRTLVCFLLRLFLLLCIPSCRGQPTDAVSKGLLANMRQSHNASLVQRLWRRARTLHQGAPFLDPLHDA